MQRATREISANGPRSRLAAFPLSRLPPSRPQTLPAWLLQFLHQPVQATQVFPQGFLRIGFRPVIDDADRPEPAALPDHLHHAQFLIAFPKMKNLFFYL